MIVTPEPDVPLDRWGELVSNRGVLVEFKAAIPQDVVKWLIDRSNATPGAPSEIKKLLILPEDNSGKQSVCLYALTGDRIVRVFSPSANYYDIQKLISDGVQSLSGGVENVQYLSGGGAATPFQPERIDAATIAIPEPGKFNIKFTPLGTRGGQRISDSPFVSDYITGYPADAAVDATTGTGATASGSMASAPVVDYSITTGTSDGVPTTTAANSPDSTTTPAATGTTDSTTPTAAATSPVTTATTTTSPVTTATSPAEAPLTSNATDTSDPAHTTDAASYTTNTAATSEPAVMTEAMVTSETAAVSESSETDASYTQPQTQIQQSSQPRTQARQTPAAQVQTTQPTQPQTPESQTQTQTQTSESQTQTQTQTPDSQTQPEKPPAITEENGGIRYMTISEVGGGRFPRFSPDVFCVVDGPKTSGFKPIRYTAPTGVRDKSELEEIILAGDKYSYNRSIDYNDTLVFKNITSIYRLYKDGFMEYNYIPLTQPAEKGSLVAALENAISYISNIERQLLGSADLVLDGIYINESDLTYRFTFDYIIDDYPVYFRYEQMQGESSIVHENAITVLANATRTVSCRWMLVDLFFASETKNMQTYFDRIEVGQNLTKMSVSDIAIAYQIDMNSGRDETAGPGGGGSYEWPVWAITSPDGVVETVRMSEG